jgi:hypothetical protein
VAIRVNSCAEISVPVVVPAPPQSLRPKRLSQRWKFPTIDNQKGRRSPSKIQRRRSKLFPKCVFFWPFAPSKNYSTSRTCEDPVPVPCSPSASQRKKLRDHFVIYNSSPPHHSYVPLPLAIREQFVLKKPRFSREKLASATFEAPRNLKITENYWREQIVEHPKDPKNKPFSKLPETTPQKEIGKNSPRAREQLRPTNLVVPEKNSLTPFVILRKTPKSPSKRFGTIRPNQKHSNKKVEGLDEQCAKYLAVCDRISQSAPDKGFDEVMSEQLNARWDAGVKEQIEQALMQLRDGK